jgi:hypothetical protein
VQAEDCRKKEEEKIKIEKERRFLWTWWMGTENEVN